MKEFNIYKDTFMNVTMVSINGNTEEENRELLTMLGVTVKVEGGLYVPYDNNDGEVISFGDDERGYKSILDIVYALDANTWFYDNKICIEDIPSELIDTEGCELKPITKVVPRTDDEYDPEDPEETVHTVEVDYYDTEVMSEKEKVTLVSLVELEVHKQVNGVYRIVDMQGANQAGIEYERFASIDEVLGRLDVYWEAYDIY